MTFEVNRGQMEPRVQFLARGKGYTAFLTSGGIVLSLRPSVAVNTSNPASPQTANRPADRTLQFTLVGGAKNPAVVGEQQQPGRINYFLGNDRSKWLTNVPTYARVRYKNVYPGIDLIYYGNQRQLEYDFAVQPGSDPRQIQFEIKGANGIAIDPHGDLAMTIGADEIHFQAPIVYQESNGQRIPVSGGYVVKDATHIAFDVANYDSAKALVIDPVLVYSTYLGGSGVEQTAGIAVDGSGNIYVAGYTSSIDFPLATLGSLPQNTNHIFVTKLNAAGTQLIYSDYIGGNSQDYAVALAVDGQNQVYVTGSTASSNFPAVSALQAQQPGPYAGFLTKVSADGSSLLFSTYLGGNTFDEPTAIAVDGQGHAHIAGLTMSSNFPVANAFQSTVSANQGGMFGTYGFLTKFTADGSSLMYSTYLAGSSNVVQDCGSPCWPNPSSAISALAVDADGSAYVAGTTNTYDFPTSETAYLTANNAPLDATVGFVTKFSGAGALSYSTYFYPSSGIPIGISGIAVDGSASAYITGTAESEGTFPVSSGSICDPIENGLSCGYAFVTKFNVSGSTLLYSTFLGVNNFASPQAITVDASGDAYVLAATLSSAFQTSNAIESFSNQSDLLLVEVDPSASTQLFSTYLGGSGSDQPNGLTVDGAGNIYVAGTTNSTDLPLLSASYQAQLGGNSDAFVMKISPTNAPAVSLSKGALQFSLEPVGVTSQVQQVTLRNMGSSDLTINSTQASGDFSENDTCGASVPAAASCTISVTFTPTLAGTRTGSITFNDDAAASPHIISLSGSGAAPGASLAPSTLTFSGTILGTTSASQTTTLTNNGTTSLTIQNIQVSGDFAQTNNCPGTLPAANSCTVTVTFTPTASGTRSGTLTITDNAAASPHTVALSGSGSDFTLAAGIPSVTVKAGVTATYSVSVAPAGGAFSSAIALACTGAPARTSCSVSPASVTPGSNPAAVTVTITTTGVSAAALPLAPAGQTPVSAALWMQLQGLGLFGVVLASSKRTQKRLPMLVLIAVIAMALLFMCACAGGTGIAAQQGQTGTASGTYSITVTGTSGSLQHSVPLTLTVQ